MKNTGFLIETRDTDYIFGAASRITHEDRNTTGDWTSFLPSDERQSGRFFDTMGCVTFSAMNSLETQMRWMLANKLISQVSLKFLTNNGYLDANGMPNFSDRFTVVMSGTTPQGNSMQAVWDSIRKDGIAPEIMWPNDLEVYDRPAYFVEPPQAVKDVAKQFLTHFKAEYEWVTKSNMGKAIKHAPIHLAAAVCPGWFSEDIVKTCSLAASHATMLYKFSANGYNDFDSYPEYRKVLALNYQLPFLLKGVLSPLLKDDGTLRPDGRFVYDRDLVAGETSIDVKHLQNRLAVVDPATGYYGPMTVAAVKQFMNYRQIGSWFERNIWPAGRRVGPKIRAVLNA